MLSDLLDARSDDRIQLNLQQQQGSASSKSNANDAQTRKRSAEAEAEGEEAVAGLMDAIQRRKVVKRVQEVFEGGWEPRLEAVSKLLGHQQSIS